MGLLHTIPSVHHVPEYPSTMSQDATVPLSRAPRIAAQRDCLPYLILRNAKMFMPRSSDGNIAAASPFYLKLAEIFVELKRHGPFSMQPRYPRPARPTGCRASVFLACCSLWLAPPVRAESVDLAPGKDNTIFSEDSESSSGQGPYLFVGGLERYGTPPPRRRRTLLAFDVAANVPAVATVDGVTLQLHVSKERLGRSAIVSINRLLKDWGESPSVSKGGRGAPAMGTDATWTHPQRTGTAWDSAGGDFDATISASTLVNATGTYTWNSDTFHGLIDDVQDWLDNPSANFGWILRGNESIAGTAKRIDSRENTSSSTRPKLTIEYTLPPYREQWVEQFFGADAGVDDLADSDHDGFNNLLEYAFNRDPRQPESGVLPVPVITAEGRLAIDFTRDTRATDLTYRVEATSTPEDPNSWTALAESVAGTAASGSGEITETGSSDTRTVTVSDSSNANSHFRRFFRLVVERTD